MKRYKHVLMFCLTLILTYWGVAFSDSIKNDIVLMIDNSGSMRRNDPHFLTKKAVTRFVENLSGDIQVAVLIFDYDINMTLPLTIVNQTTKDTILSSTEKIDFRGLFTRIPSAMERAIYELKMNGRDDSQKTIIFITDGIVDTGDKTRDADKARWLRENLSEDAARAGIKIFGIAFTDQADFELIQYLAQKTKGEYFRAFLAKDIQEIFTKINSIIVSAKPKLAKQAPLPVLKKPQKVPVVKQEKASKPSPKPEPAKPKAQTPEEEDTQWIMIVIVGVLGLALIILAIALMGRKKPKKETKTPSISRPMAGEPVPKAALKDLHGSTEHMEYDIFEKVTIVGREAGTKGDGIDYITIEKETISREHAVIEYKNHSFWVMDQGSTNGTLVNNQEVENETRLKDGDIITFDIYEFQFALHKADQEDIGNMNKTVFRAVGDTLDE
jgi:uncharacterized protein YegL